MNLEALANRHLEWDVFSDKYLYLLLLAPNPWTVPQLLGYPVAHKGHDEL
jgi:hypothetical protein